MTRPDPTPSGPQRVALVVPTLRRSPWWRQSIEAAGRAADHWLAEDPRRQVVLVVVDPASLGFSSHASTSQTTMAFSGLKAFVNESRLKENFLTCNIQNFHLHAVCTDKERNCPPHPRRI